MKRELEISIRDNWYCDQYPTWCDYFAYKSSRWVEDDLGKFMWFILDVYHFIGFFRVFEIFFYRRKQLNYF